MVGSEGFCVSVQRLPAAVLRPLRDANTFESTVERLAAAIRLGVFSCSEQLPPKRDLAQQLGDRRVARRRNGRNSAGPRRRHRRDLLRAGRTPNRAELIRRWPQLRDALEFRRVVEPGAAYLAATGTCPPINVAGHLRAGGARGVGEERPSDRGLTATSGYRHRERVADADRRHYPGAGCVA
jgi:hypothetical protein